MDRSLAGLMFWVLRDEDESAEKETKRVILSGLDQMLGVKIEV
jgi:hypothetical protein